MFWNSNLYLQVKIYFHLLIKYHYQYHQIIFLIHVHVFIFSILNPMENHEINSYHMLPFHK